MFTLKFIISLMLMPRCIQTSNFQSSEIWDLSALHHAPEIARYEIFVNVTSSRHSCDARFLSVTLSSPYINYPWNESQFVSEKLHNLARALSPADLRVGGTMADFLTFDPDSGAGQADRSWLKYVKEARHYLDSGWTDLSKDVKNFTVTGRQWDTFISFVAKSGWDLMFDVNLFKWKDSLLWDPANARQLLDYSSERGYRIPYFQLGNEPNSFKHNFNFTISPDTLVKDFHILKSLISQYPLYKASKLYGPDVTTLDIHEGSRDYLKQFISAGGCDIVDELSLHFYYLNGRTATAEQFLQPSVLDLMQKEIDFAVEISKGCPHEILIRLTETSSCYGGGAPGLSDAYIAGFLWLDKLGLAARNGFTRVFRQTFLGANYALVSGDLNPNPDYYLSVLYKQLIEGPVFGVVIHPPSKNLRVYAQCARTGLYTPGTLVVYFLNLQDTQVLISLTQFKDADIDLFMLTPGDTRDLKSRSVRLNGKLLQMDGTTLPPLKPQPHTGNVTVEAQSFGFVVIPQADIPLCVKYFAGTNSDPNRD